MGERSKDTPQPTKGPDIESETLADGSKTLADPHPFSGATEELHHPLIPDHELIRCIGRGSYGEVWLARNAMGTYRAVKIVYRDSFEHARPFEREFNGIKKFEPISRSHEGFVDILQVGKAEGHFYYVMELADDVVTGQEVDPVHYEPTTLRSVLKERGRLGFDRCLQLGSSLSQALGHLHKHGLIHRDIKPSNIILVYGQPKLADIGLVADQSEAKSFVGTEGFIPPEGPGTPQADIYSLGKVLYEMATGKDRHEFPELPTLVGEDAAELGLMELNSVFLKACQSDWHRRYQSASEMGEDLLLLQGGRSVARAQAVERRLALLSKLSVAGLTLTLLVLAAAWFFQHQAKREADLRKRAVAGERGTLKNLIQQYTDNGNRLAEEGDLFGAFPWYVKALASEQDPAAAVRHRYRIGATLNMAPKLVQLWTHAGIVNDAAFSPDGRLVVSASDDKTARIWEAEGGEAARAVLQHGGEVRRAIFSPDGSYLLTIARKPTTFAGAADRGGLGEVKLWDVATGRLVADVPHNGLVPDAAFSPDGKTFLTACGDGYVRLGDSKTGQIRRTLEHPAPVSSLACSPDGKLALTGADDARLRVWDLGSGVGLFTNLVSGRLPSVSFSPDGRIYGGNCESTGTVLYETATGQLLRTLYEQNLIGSGGFTFSPSGDRVLVVGWNQRGGVWDVATGSRLVAINFESKVTFGRTYLGAVFSPDGQSLLTWMEDGVARVWSARDGQRTQAPLRHNGRVSVAAFGPESRRIVTGGTDGIVRMWDLASDASVEPRHLHYIAAAAGVWSPDGKRVFSNGEDTVGVLWDADTGKQIGSDFEHWPNPFGLTSVNWSRDGRTLVTADGAGAFRVWDGINAQPRSPMIQVLTNKPFAAELSPDGQVIAVGGELSDFRLLRAATRETIASQPSGYQGLAFWPKFSPSGRWAVTMGADTVRLRNPTNALSISAPMKHSAGVFWTSFSYAEKRLATAGEDQVARVWDLPSGRESLAPLRHADKVWSVVFSPDDRHLLTASGDGTSCVWDAYSGRKELTLPHGVPVTAAKFSRDGLLIATACGRGARVWDAVTGEPLTSWLRSVGSGEVSSVNFSPSDERLLTAGGIAAQVWHLAPDERSIDLLQTHATVLGSDAFPGQDVTQAWGQLTAGSPESRKVNPQHALRWHRAVADHYRMKGAAEGLAAHMRVYRIAHPDDAAARRDAAVALLARGQARLALAMDAAVLPQRSSQAEPAQLDLTLVYNRRLQDSSSNLGNEGALDFVSGLSTYAGVRFDVRGLIYLDGMGSLMANSRAEPTNSPSIPVHRLVHQFHMLHASFWETTDGTPIGRYVLRYVDGQVRELPIRYGIDVRNFWLHYNDRFDPPLEAQLAWRGHQRNAELSGSSIGYFKRTYPNPRPDVEVTSLELQSTQSLCSPILLAITVE